MNKEVDFKGVCPVELFSDMYALNKKGILEIEDFTFEKDHVDAVYYDMWQDSSHVRIDEFCIWFGMYINQEINKLILYVGPGGGEYIVRLDLTDDVLDFYNKWSVFKEDNPSYEESKIVPPPKVPSREEIEAFMEQIKCEACLLSDHCDGIFCLRE